LKAKPNASVFVPLPKPNGTAEFFASQRFHHRLSWGYAKALRYLGMLLDQYLLPLTEIALSIVFPLVLTLKNLQLAAQPAQALATSLKTQRSLIFWLCYWISLFFLSYAGVNGHFLFLFTVFYALKNQVVLTQLVNFYRSQVLTYCCHIWVKLSKNKVTEDDIDAMIEDLQEKISCDAQFFEKVTSLKPLGQSMPSTKSPEEQRLKHFVPLDIRRIEDYKRGTICRVVSDQVFTLGKKVTKLNSRTTSC
jgi:hypothetical protein